MERYKAPMFSNRLWKGAEASYTFFQLPGR